MRFALLIAISLFIGIGLASTVKKKDLKDDPRRCKRQLEEIAIPLIILGRLVEVLPPIANHHPYPHWTEASAPARTSSPSPRTSPTPATSPTPSPSRTPAPPTPSLRERCPNCDSNEEPRILMNYELGAFRQIPRTLFTFQVEALPTMENSPQYQAEYILINPEYSANTSPDRHRHIPNVYQRRRKTNPVRSTQITERNFWSLTGRIQCAIGNLLRITRNINEQVAAANERLREMQRIRFIARQEHIETHFRWQRAGNYGIPPEFNGVLRPMPYLNDDMLSQAFFHEVRHIARLMDERSNENLDLLRMVRQRDCVLYGQAIKNQIGRAS